MKEQTPLERLIKYSENILEHSTINAHLIIAKANELLPEERKVIESAYQDSYDELDIIGDGYTDVKLGRTPSQYFTTKFKQ